MKKNILLLALFSALIFVFTGCGKLEELTQNSIIVNKDGSIEVIMVDTFDKNYYNESELMNFVNTEVNAYNQAHGTDKITVGDHSLADGVMTLNMTFADMETYNNYMPTKIYVGTLSGCVSAGYDLNRSLVKYGSEDKTIGKTDMLDMGSTKVVITYDATAVRTPSKISYYSQDMTTIDKRTVSSSSSGCYFVLY